MDESVFIITKNYLDYFDNNKKNNFRDNAFFDWFKSFLIIYFIRYTLTLHVLIELNSQSIQFNFNIVTISKQFPPLDINMANPAVAQFIIILIVTSMLTPNYSLHNVLLVSLNNDLNKTLGIKSSEYFHSLSLGHSSSLNSFKSARDNYIPC